MKTTGPASTKFLFLLLVLYITLFFKLGDMAFVGADEPRYARVAEEMWQSHDYVVPTLRGQPWLEKPPLYYWLAAASYSLFGANETSARLPSALAAAFSVLILWWVAKQLWNEEVGFFAALIAATAPLFFSYNRAASTDPLFSSFLNVAFLFCLYAFSLENAFWSYPISGVMLGLATLAKGPVALVLASFSLVPVLAVFFSRKRLLGIAASLLACVIVALPWYWQVIRRTGFDFISVFFLNHNLARFFTAIHHHEHPFYFYLLVLALGMYPWTFAFTTLGWTSRHEVRGSEDNRHSSFVLRHLSAARRLWTLDLRPATCDLRLVFLAGWILMPLIFFSVSKAKLPAYVLPLVVPLSLSVSLLLSRLDEIALEKKRTMMFGSLLLASLILTFAGAFISKKNYETSGMGLAIGFCVIAGSSMAFLLSRHSFLSALLALAGTNVVVVLFLTIAVLPTVENFHSARYVIQKSLPRLPAGENFYQYRYFHQTVDYYSGGRAVMESIDDLRTLREVLQSHSPLWIVTEVIEIPELQAQGDFQIQVVAARGNVAVVKVSRR